MNEFDQHIKVAQRRNLAAYFVVGGLAVALIVFYILWLFLSKGYAFKVAPEKALSSVQIKVIEGLGFSAGNSVYSFGGVITTRVKADKFLPKVITVNSNSPSTINIILEPSPGVLVAQSNPEFEDTLWTVNQTPIHTGTQLKQEIKPGQYQLTVSQKYHQPLTQQVTLNSEETTDVLFQLHPIQGTVSLQSIPSAASVSINGAPVGLTPLQTNLEGGKYQIQLEKSGYEPLRESVEVTHELSAVERAYRLEPVKGQLILSATPEDGTLLIDGKEQRLGQHQFAANKAHAVLYTKAGYFDHSENIMVNTEKPTYLDIQLKPERGLVNIETNPNTDILLNGKRVGQGAFKATLPATTQKLEFIQKGYRSVTRMVTPSSLRTSQVKVQLLTEFNARRKEGRTLFATQLGIDLVKFKLSDFTMGSPPNEVGRRRNETQIPVRFNKSIWVARHELTEAQYHPFDSSVARTKYPVSNVTWLEAAAYCNWLSEQEALSPFYQFHNNQNVSFDPNSKGYRLLSEAEWEWLAKRSNRSRTTLYPWGSSSKLPAKAGNFADQSIAGKQTFVLKNFNDGYPGKSPVGQLQAEISGLYDMAGNVSEWVNDFNSPTSPIDAPYTDYLGPKSGVGHIWKGGHYQTGKISALRGSFKESTESSLPTLGFRIARYN